MNPLQKPLRGTPRTSSASFIAQVADATRKVRESEQLNGTRIGGAPGLGRVLVRNSSGVDVDRFGVLAISGIAIDPADNETEFLAHPVLDGAEPSGELRNFVILQQPLLDGAVGYGIAIGVTIALVLVEEGEEDDVPGFADSDPEGETAHLLASGSGPARILWRAEGPGEQYALVAIGSGPGGTFPVVLDQTGGTQGTVLLPASWTYTVTDLAGNTLAEDVDPTAAPHNWRRPQVGWMSVANAGYAHRDADGDLVLGWINEVSGVEACSSG